MCQNWSSCTPTTLHEWYHFDHGTPVNDINDVTRKKLERNIGFGHFSKLLPQRKSNLDDISSSNLHRIIILVSTHMFSWSKNRMKPRIERLGHSCVAKSEKSKMTDRVIKDSFVSMSFYFMQLSSRNTYYYPMMKI